MGPGGGGASNAECVRRALLFHAHTIGLACFQTLERTGRAAAPFVANCLNAPVEIGLVDAVGARLRIDAFGLVVLRLRDTFAARFVGFVRTDLVAPHLTVALCPTDAATRTPRRAPTLPLAAPAPPSP